MDNIQKALNYATQLIGIKYQYWKEDTNCKYEPMWAENNPPPDIDILRRNQ